MNKLTKLFERHFIGQAVGTFLLALILALVVGSAALAANPPQPTYGSATIDGSYAEWNLTADFFANMYRAGKVDKAVESKLYLRYDCASQTGYALVLVEPGVKALMQPSDAFVKLGNSNKLVDGNNPRFAWIQPDAQTNTARGWEASFTLAPGSYPDLNVHTQVEHDGSQTSAVAGRAIPLTLECATPQAGSLAVTKYVNLNGAQLDAAFTICAVGPAPATTESCQQIGIAGGTLTWSSLTPGGYTVIEKDAGTAWSVQVNGSPATVTAGQTATAAVTNSYQQPDFPAPSFGSCYNPAEQLFRLTVANNATAQVYIGYDIYGQANSFVNLGSFEPGESKGFSVAQEVTLRAYIGTNGQDWILQSGTHVLSVAGHTADGLLCKGSIEASKFRDGNANGVQEADEISLGNWSMAVYAGTVEENKQPVATGVTDPTAGHVIFDALLPGEYTVCEGRVEGWLPTIALCQPVTVTSEEAASVTFGNVPGGRIIVDKIAAPAEAPDKFDFSLTNGETTVASFALSGADTPFDSGLLLPGAYIIEEAGTAGWDLSDVTCVDANTGQQASDMPNPIAIALQAGQTVTCTFTNVKQPVTPTTGSLVVTKQVAWGNVTPDETQEFYICLSGPSFFSGSEEGACQRVGSSGGNLLWSDLIPGTYMVAEIYPGIDWSVTGSGVEVSITAGNRVQHTITNTAEADVPPPGGPEHGSLAITKIVDWNGTSPVDAQTFRICITGPTFPTGSETGACQNVGFYGGNLLWEKLIAGTYTVIENDPGADWTVMGSGADISVVKDEQAAHTIVNTARQQPPVEPKTGNLAVTKQVIWGTVPVEDITFEVCIRGPSFPNGTETDACHSFGQNGGTHTWTDLLPGTYVVTEVGVDLDQWTVTGSGASVIVAAENLAGHTVKNSAVDVGGESGIPTVLDPTDEPAAIAAHLYLPAVQR